MAHRIMRWLVPAQIVLLIYNMILFAAYFPIFVGNNLAIAEFLLRLLSGILLIYFIIDAFKRKELSMVQKILWAIGILFVSYLVVPIYYYTIGRKEGGL